MTNKTFTEQAEAALARAKAIDAYTPRELTDERIWAERAEEAKALYLLGADLSADADDLSGLPFGQDEDGPYEQMISDQLHEDADS